MVQVLGSPNGFYLRPNTAGDALVFNASKLATAILDSLNVEENYRQLIIDVEEREFSGVDGKFYAISL